MREPEPPLRPPALSRAAESRSAEARPIEPALVPEGAQILVVEEDREHAERLVQAIEDMGFEADLVASPQLALEHLEERDYDLVVTELYHGDVTAFDVLEAAKRKPDDVEVVVVTGRGDPAAAVEAMSRGALTYLTKPVNMLELRTVIRRSLERVGLTRRAVELEQRLDARFGFEALVGTSTAMQRVFDQVRQVAPTSATVLILGETGTGKELVAKTIHQNSPRRRFPFVAINCAALTESLLESELFGHEKGAFTGATGQRKGRFEYANKGTIFLDELGDMPLTTQVKLLRALEEREVVRVGSNIPIKVDVRLLAATNVNLEEKIAQGAFREDLYYRLKVVTIRMPPLRERKSDIPLLIDRFIREFGQEYGKDIAGITPEARRVLTDHAWRGNVRELRSAVQHMIVLANTPMLDLEHIDPEIREAPEPLEAKKVEGLAGLSLEDVERELIRKTLEMTDGNREQAAKILGMGERTLYRKLRKYDIK